MSLGEMHYIITARTSEGVLRTCEGIFTPRPGVTRQQAFLQIVDDFGLSTANIMFFSLEPNRLGTP